MSKAQQSIGVHDRVKAPDGNEYWVVASSMNQKGEWLCAIATRTDGPRKYFKEASLTLLTHAI